LFCVFILAKYFCYRSFGSLVSNPDPLKSKIRDSFRRAGNCLLILCCFFVLFFSVKPFAQSHYAVGASPSANNKSGTSNGGTGSSAAGSGGSAEMAGLLAPSSATPNNNAPSSSSAASVTTVATTAGLTPPAPPPPWEGRAIATHKLRLVEFSAFLEQQRDPDTVRSLS
jgi:uncharacterized membrane protein YfcA